MPIKQEQILCSRCKEPKPPVAMDDHKFFCSECWHSLQFTKLIENCVNTTHKVSQDIECGDEVKLFEIIVDASLRMMGK
jgi:recombinational DNA repair protein (RecF pathway)